MLVGLHICILSRKARAVTPDRQRHDKSEAVADFKCSGSALVSKPADPSSLCSQVMLLDLPKSVKTLSHICVAPGYSPCMMANWNSKQHPPVLDFQTFEC